MKNYVRRWIIAILCLLGSCTTMRGMEYLENIDPLFIATIALSEANEQPEARSGKIRAREVLTAFKAFAGELRKAVCALEHWSCRYLFVFMGPINDFKYTPLERESDEDKQLQGIFTKISAWKTWEAIINEKFHNAHESLRTPIVDGLKSLFDKTIGDFTTDDAVRTKIKNKLAEADCLDPNIFSDGFACICAVDEFVAAAGKLLTPSNCSIL